MDSEPSEEQIQDAPGTTTSGPLVIQGGDHSSRPGVVQKNTCQTKPSNSRPFTNKKQKKNLRNSKQDNFQMKQVATRRPRAKTCHRNEWQARCRKPQKNFSQTQPWLANFFPREALQPLRKTEFEDVGTGSKIPKIDSPTRRYPPFSVGMVYEHNDEELPEPDL